MNAPQHAARRVRIDKDEWWPVFTIEYLDGDTPLPEDVIERAELCFAEFDEVQRILKEAYEHGR
jgi:hypothetical protein